MKIRNLLGYLLSVIVLTLGACSADKFESGDITMPDDEGNSRFMSVLIRNTDGVRSRSADDYEDGTSDENEVKSIRFYFFDADGNPRDVVAATGKNYYDCKEINEVNVPTGSQPNVEKMLAATIVLSSNRNDLGWNNLDCMVAVVNFETIDGFPQTSLSLSQLNQLISDYSATEKGKFIMTSSSFGAESYGCAARITPENIKDTEADALANPVEIFVERAVAKVRVKWANEVNTVVNDVSVKDATGYETGKWTAVMLKDKKTNGVDVTDSNGEQIYVLFKDWRLTFTADRTYLFKQVDNGWSFGNWQWNHPEYNRSYWAMNPENMTLKTFKHIDEAGAPTVGIGSSNMMYCMENAADYYNMTDATNERRGFKTKYDPQYTISNRTQVYLPVILATLNEDKTEATPVDFAIWGDSKYTRAGLVTAMLNTVTDILYKDKGDGSGDKVSLDENDVELVTASKMKLANSGSEASRRYLSYIKIHRDFTGQLYKKTAAGSDEPVEAISIADANAILADIPGARCWNRGMGYYYVDINHLNTGDGTEEQGKIGVVRNHVYDLEINSVFGLPTPVLNPDEIVITQKPDNEVFFIGARLNILSWRVVSQKVNIEW